MNEIKLEIIKELKEKGLNDKDIQELYLSIHNFLEGYLIDKDNKKYDSWMFYLFKSIFIQAG